MNVGQDSSEEEDYERFARIKPATKSKQAAFVGQTKRDTSTDGQYMLSREAHSTEEVLGNENILQRKAQIQNQKESQQQVERETQEAAKAAAKHDRVFARTHLQEDEEMPELMADLEREGQRVFTVQQTHINKVSVTFIDRGGHEVTARKDACRERCWMVVGDTGVSLFDGEEMCLMETHLYTDMQPWSYQVRNGVEEVQLTIKGTFKSKVIHLPSEDAKLIVQEMSERHPLTAGGKATPAHALLGVDADEGIGADLDGSGGLVGALVAKAAAKHDRVFARTHLQEDEEMPELMADLEREGQRVFTVQQTHINKVSVTFIDRGGHEVTARKDACRERCWMVVGDTGVSLFDGIALCLIATYLYAEMQSWRFNIEHGLEEVVLAVKEGKKKTKKIRLPSEDAKVIVAEMTERHPHEPFDAGGEDGDEETPYNLAELEQQGHTIYCVQQTHVNKISVSVTDPLGRPMVARKDACRERCWFVVGDDGVLLFDGVEICQIGKYKYMEMQSWSDGAMGDNVTLMFDQGPRKKTKIIHLPAENATEIAEEMTARFRKIKQKNDKQAAIERKKAAKTRRAEQQEAQKKQHTQDAMMAKFKSDLAIHEPVGDRGLRNGKPGMSRSGGGGGGSSGSETSGQQKTMGGVKLLSAKQLKKQHQLEQLAKANGWVHEWEEDDEPDECTDCGKPNAWWCKHCEACKLCGSQAICKRADSSTALGQPPKGVGTMPPSAKGAGGMEKPGKTDALAVINKNVKDADVAAVGWWLCSLNAEIGSNVALFKQARIDGPKLLKLSDKDMTKMGLRKEHRDNIIEARTELLVSNALAKAR